MPMASFKSHPGMKYIALIVLLLLSVSAITQAQYVNFGQDPAFLKWRQIKTENFQLIYPDYYEANAQMIANIYTQLYRHSNSLDHTPGKMSMILHTNGGVSNGSVAWAPKRSDLYMTPPQESSDTWLEHLCTHEFRHIVQLDKINQGMTKGFYYLLGEQFPVALVGLYVPMWFIEGDAVCFETSIGQLGRGRSPEFINEMKAQVLEKCIYSYDKAVLGSYKDFVPNRYTMGYFMSANARINYGNDIWAKALTRVGRRPYGITPFTTSLKRSMLGKRDSLWSSPAFVSLFADPQSVKKANTHPNARRTLYFDNFSELRQLWLKEHQSPDTIDTIAVKNKYYSNYYYPTPQSDGSVIAYKKGLREAGAFVIIHNGQESILTRTGNLDDYKFACNNNTLVWGEYRPGIRWEHGGKQTLVSYDLNRKKYKRHKSKVNRFAPFAVGDLWGCVEVDHTNQAFIVILDTTLEKEINRIKAGKSELFIHPAYDNGQIVSVVQSPQGNRLELINPTTGKRIRLTEPSAYELDNPIMTGDTIWFRASYNGNNALYAKYLNTGVIQNVLNTPFGVCFPAFNANRDNLYFSFYTAKGYQPGKIGLNNLKKQSVDKETFRLADSLKKREDWQLNLATDSVYSSKKYRKTAHLLNVHSWGLGVGKDEDLDFGALINSQNKLSTLSFTGGYVYKSGYKYGAVVLNASYKALWPVIDFDLESGRYNGKSTLATIATHKIEQRTDTLFAYYSSNLTKAGVTVKLPLNLSVKNYNRYLTPYVRYKIEASHNTRIRETYAYHSTNDTISYFEKTDHRFYDLNVPKRHYQLLEYGVSFNNQTRMSTQELSPRWGQNLRAGFANTPLKDIHLGNIWWADGRFYFPGLFKNHSLNGYIGYQQMSDKNCNFSNQISYPRGIELYGYRISTLRTNYQLPLACPDFNIGSLVYIKRIYGSAFFDMGKEENLTGSRHFQSYGAEFLTNVHFLRITTPFTVGFRTGYETQTRKMFANFLFSVQFSI